MKRDGGSHARVRFRDINISDVLMYGDSTVGGNYYLGRDNLRCLERKATGLLYVS